MINLLHIFSILNIYFSLIQHSAQSRQTSETLYYQERFPWLFFNQTWKVNIYKYTYLSVVKENAVHVGKAAMIKVQERRQKESNQQWFQAFNQIT